MKCIILISKAFIGFALCILPFNLKAQVEYLTESKSNIYWQPDVQIDFSDYQSPANDSCVKNNEKYGLKMFANIQFKSVVDIPEKSGELDKLYLAPVFCKHCSCILSEDSLSLKVDRLLFDIAEILARNIRKELLELQSKMNIDNTNVMFFSSIKNEGEEIMLSTWSEVLTDILIDKENNAYIEWRQVVDENLRQTESYATQPEDCFRLILGKPIEKGYNEAKAIMEDMRSISIE